MIRARNRIMSGSRIGAGSSDGITWESKPDYDAWGWDSHWGCYEWRRWHEELVKKYGRTKANDLWMAAWEKQDIAEYAYNWCKYDRDFAQYLAKQGLDVGHVLSRLITSTTGVLEDAVNSSAKILKWAPWMIGIGAALYFGPDLMETGKRTATKYKSKWAR